MRGPVGPERSRASKEDTGVAGWILKTVSLFFEKKGQGQGGETMMSREACEAQR